MNSKDRVGLIQLLKRTVTSIVLSKNEEDREEENYEYRRNLEEEGSYEESSDDADIEEEKADLEEKCEF